MVEAPGLTLVERCVRDFGKQTKKLNLTDIVIDLYDAALQETSRTKYIERDSGPTCGSSTRSEPAVIYFLSQGPDYKRQSWYWHFSWPR